MNELLQGNYVRELTVSYKSRDWCPYHIDDPYKVFKLMEDKFSRDTQENFIAIFLNNKNRVHGWQVISRGTVSETLVHPREIFKAAILTNASGVIVAHNHPTGILTPSTEDIKTTARLVEAGKIIGIPIIDHVIFCTDYLSLREEGYIK